MNDDLADHRPSEVARRRALAAGLDLEAIKRDDPTTYRMLCSVPVVKVAPELRDEAQAPLHAALSSQQLFEAEVAGKIQVLAFPGPGDGELDRLDRLLAQVAENQIGRYAFYREVRDRTGTRRELDLPSSPERQPFRPDSMVGPFANEAQANEWAQSHVAGRDGQTYDTLKYAGAWFCDVFTADQV